MPNYLRPKRPGAAVFLTVALADRESDLLVREVAALRIAVRQTKGERPFRIDAWVVLPDHMHFVWTLPEGDADFSTRVGAIKSRFTRRVGFHPTALISNGAVGRNVSTVGWNPTLRSPSKIQKGDAGIWQRRFWDHHIRDKADFAAHVRYCWINPVKHGFVARPED